jgi:hypothetical protein
MAAPTVSQSQSHQWKGPPRPNGDGRQSDGAPRTAAVRAPGWVSATLAADGWAARAGAAAPQPRAAEGIGGAAPSGGLQLPLVAQNFQLARWEVAPIRGVVGHPPERAVVLEIERARAVPRLPLPYTPDDAVGVAELAAMTR